MNKDNESKYSQAGVDIDKGNEFVSRIKKIVSETHTRGVVGNIGGFSGLYSIGGANYDDPVLVAATDGVGTKLTVAKICDKHDTIGIDLVAMCVNDIVVSGAKPLFFLDYFSTSKLELETATDIVRGIAKGCKIAGCALIGGETAEMPGLYQEKDYDLAGFSVGMIEKNKIIDGSDIKIGDTIIGLTSTGLHSNGFSLVRNIFFEELKLKPNDYVQELSCTVEEELLKPTRIYVASILSIIKNYPVNGIIHNTGGGFLDNIPRILPKNSRAVIYKDSWSVPPVFSFLQEKGRVSSSEMFRTFNMGIGMMLVVHNKDVDDIIQHIKATGETPYIIGKVETNDDSSQEKVVFTDKS